MAKLSDIKKLIRLDTEATYLLLISPHKIPHLAIVQHNEYYSLTHKKVIISDPFQPYFKFLKRTERKMLFVKVKAKADGLREIFEQYTKAAPDANTCLEPVRDYLLSGSEAEFVYELIPDLQAAGLIEETYHLNMEEELNGRDEFNLQEYSKAAIFSYIESLNFKHAKRE